MLRLIVLWALYNVRSYKYISIIRLPYKIHWPTKYGSSNSWVTISKKFGKYVCIVCDRSDANGLLFTSYRFQALCIHGCVLNIPAGPVFPLLHFLSAEVFLWLNLRFLVHVFTKRILKKDSSTRLKKGEDHSWTMCNQVQGTDSSFFFPARIAWNT